MDMEAQGNSEHPEALRLWLRLLTCTQLVEKQVRNHLREQFDTTLPRFDLMAQLQRNPDGLKMNELSRRMMVTGGNVTGITDQLVAEGLVERLEVDGDRRAYRVRLTAQRASGRKPAAPRAIPAAGGRKPTAGGRNPTAGGRNPAAGRLSGSSDLARRRPSESAPQESM
jgi:DNA-binding MarR family transcriptional regulator